MACFDALTEGMRGRDGWTEVVVLGGWWWHTMEMPAVPINHLPTND